MIPNMTLKLSSAKILNNQTFYDYYTRLRLLALSIFEWVDLPDSISPRFIEEALFTQGRAIFFYDDKLGHLCLNGSPEGQLNVYGEPLKVRVSGIGGYNRSLDPGNYVMVRNNYDALNTEQTIRLYAQRLAQAERSIDTNINAQRTPMLLICEEKQRLTLKNVYSQYQGNEPVIYADKSMNPDMIKAVNTQAPYVADKLMLYKRDIWNECMTFLGINNANTDKKERLIVPEVEANDNLITMSGQVMLLTRQQAADQINQMFGLNISVRQRDLGQEDPDQDQEQDLEEGDDNG